MVPKEGMRPHRFDRENIRIPRMVTTLRHVPLGVTAPLPQYYVDLCDWFEVTPIQLSPNSYMLADGLYILFNKVNLGAPSMREVSYFFRLAQSQPGYFYLVVQQEHNKKGLSEGRNTHVKKWKDTFFYVYNTSRVTTQFNPNPGILPNTFSVNGRVYHYLFPFLEGTPSILFISGSLHLISFFFSSLSRKANSYKRRSSPCG